VYRKLNDGEYLNEEDLVFLKNFDSERYQLLNRSVFAKAEVSNYFHLEKGLFS
jgi:hypothetical protein